MKICDECSGKGCESCDFEGCTSQVTFTVGKINNRKKLGFDEYQAKKSKNMKFDKKNAVRGE